jgi:hypothetical protein
MRTAFDVTLRAMALADTGTAIRAGFESLGHASMDEGYEQGVGLYQRIVVSVRAWALNRRWKF